MTYWDLSPRPLGHGRFALTAPAAPCGRRRFDKQDASVRCGDLHAGGAALGAAL